MFFREGELLEARVDQTRGLKAAYQIFAWDEVTLSIQNECPEMDNNINSDLQPIILEAMRLKDEAQLSPGDLTDPNRELVDDEGTVKGRVSTVGRIKDLLRNQVGDRCGLEDIYEDDALDGLLQPMIEFGGKCNFGNIKLVYFDSGGEADTIVVAGERNTVVTVNPKCPRDKIIQVLSGVP